ncbi:hypothetical protein [Peribacillus simplex]|uniref:hypothetical protein n=1 Tax=Peribacillus simplex TaxID=1478 RepID=UPI0011A80725|nr:hypothetical protein [Peribacillus simplex]
MENHTSTLGSPIAGVVELRLTKHSLYSPHAAAYIGVLDRNPRLSPLEKPPYCSRLKPFT